MGYQVQWVKIKNPLVIVFMLPVATCKLLENLI